VRRAAVASAVALILAACNGQFRFDDQASALLPEAGAPPGDDAGAAPNDAATDTPVDSAVPHVGCMIDADCKLSSLHCDEVSGACVACTTDAHCATSQGRRCDAALHRCVQCGIDGDCNPDQRCESSTRRCVTKCESLTGCNSTAPFCDLDRGFCIRCKTKVECIIPGDARLCDDANGMCVECVVDSDCPKAKPRCDRTTGTCAECVTSAECTSDKPLCDPTTRTCVSG
jgi:hypothetical protein